MSYQPNLFNPLFLQASKIVHMLIGNFCYQTQIVHKFQVSLIKLSFSFMNAWLTTIWFVRYFFVSSFSISKPFSNRSFFVNPEFQEILLKLQSFAFFVFFLTQLFVIFMSLSFVCPSCISLIYIFKAWSQILPKKRRFSCFKMCVCVSSRSRWTVRAWSFFPPHAWILIGTALVF